MVDITHKSFSLRKAIATAIVRTSSPETIAAIQAGTVPKGNVLEFARAAGLLAIKKTSDLIPDCHPLPVEFAAITYAFDGLDLIISVEVHTIYKTGVEVEAMHGASLTALVIYDMLKPIDKKVEIAAVRLERKTGGKTEMKDDLATGLTAAVIVCSDRIANGAAVDASGRIIVQKLEAMGIKCLEYSVVPDDIDLIRRKAVQLADGGFGLLLFTGGTGLSHRDVTPDAIAPLLTTAIPGIMETARTYGQQRIGTSMLSRGVAGFINETLVMTLPGSAGAAREYMDALFPQVLHVFRVRKGEGH